MIRRFAALSLIPLFLLLAPPALSLDDYSVHIETIEKARQRAGVKGAVIVLIKDNKIVWQHASGVADADANPVTLQTEFEAASMGKMLTAFMIMQLIEEGRYTLATPLEDPRLVIEEGCEVPSIGHALSHTAGLGNDLRALALHPACHPGSEFSYAGQGYMVLQQMVDQIASGTIEDVMMKRVFVPLSMKSASFQPRDTPDFATGHIDLAFGFLSSRAPEPMQNLAWAIAGFLVLVLLVLSVWWFKRFRLLAALPLSLLTPPVLGLVFIAVLMQITAPVSRILGTPNLASSLQLSAPDLANFALELMAPTQIGEEVSALMFEEQVEIGERIAWASGIGIDRSEGRVTYWHWGSNPGFQSLFVIEPGTGNGIVIMTNTGGFLDFVSKRRGGYNMAKDVARTLLEIDGAWDVRGYR